MTPRSRRRKIDRRQRTRVETDRSRLPDVLPVGVLRFVAGVGVTDVNRAWRDLTGLGGDESLRDGWMSAVVSPDAVVARGLLEQSARGRVPCTAEWELQGRESRSAVQVIVRPDDARRVPACIATVVDLTAERAHEADLVYRATHDSLTGLLNRGEFVARVEHAVARLARRQSLLAVLFVDLDGFKSINDRFGHVVGDRVLVATAERLSSALRPEDTLARWGGDEFVVLCEDLTHSAEAATVTDRIRTSLSRSLTVDGCVIPLGATVGVGYPDESDMTPEALVDRADLAMYAGKRRRSPENHGHSAGR